MMRFRVARGLAALATVALVACDQPSVGPSVSAAPPPTPGVQATLLDGGVDVDGSIVVRYSLVKDGKPVTGVAAAALAPAFTLAELATDAQSQKPAWRSLLLTGPETNPAVPVAGPGTAAGNVLTNQRQPGSESSGVFRELGGGAFTYTFKTVSPRTSTTLRAGLYLSGTPGDARTCSTLDFTSDGSAPASRELVLDANCAKCHGAAVSAHGGRRVGVRLCVTCHTLQHADEDTIDPAAMTGPFPGATAPIPATAATNPNPLDLGRLVHRIHRGKHLPTLYRSSSQDPAPPLPSATPLPLPFSPPSVSVPLTPPLAPRNPAEPGRKYAVVGFQSHEFVFGKIGTRSDNGLTWDRVVEGVGFPRDLRSCDACHLNAAQASSVQTEIHRRTCAGCHPDVWYGEGGTDVVHLAHPGGPQLDDSKCGGCHVAVDPNVPGQKLYAPIAEIHVPPQLSPRANALRATIVAVRNLVPGGVDDPGDGVVGLVGPTVVFTLQDEDGTVTPLDAPTPATNASSPLPRRFASSDGSSITLAVFGPTSDYLTGQFTDKTRLPGTESVPLTLAADAQGRFSYTFTAKLPPTATGTWMVGLEARRRGPVSPPYDIVTDSFRWPYTGELVTESPDNAVAYVDTSVGTFPGGGNPVPRRTVVELTRCESCHLRLNLHGGQRHAVEYCVGCHAPDRTDVGRRPGMAGSPPTGSVNLAATWDGLEERSIDFKTMIHRIHTGEHVGSAELPKPFVVYGYGSSAYFFDDVRFPNDLSRCTTCHASGAYRLESIPSDARPVVANETPTIRHAGTGAHAAGEPMIRPLAAPCVSCHGSPNTRLHAAQHTSAQGAEGCASCHGASGTLSVDKVHGIPATP
jgi:OmcA/MtrC family decaheme c-type cytochrome